MKWIIIGSGINGLVAANYLARAGHQVTILERTPHIGGAARKGWHRHKGQSYPYAHGATVLGMMQNFILEETGLAHHLELYSPAIGKTSPLSTAFDQDLKRVVNFLQNGYREAIPPSIEQAKQSLGETLTRRWIQGDARSLLDFYLKDEETKIFHAICVNESGTVLLDEPFSAFSIPLMYSGSVFDGDWGYVKGGIWQIPRFLKKINDKLGVETLTGATIEKLDPKTKCIRYIHQKKIHERSADQILFTTDPLSAARLIEDKELTDKISSQRLTGTSGKLVLFFRGAVQWKDCQDDAFRHIILNSDLNTFDQATRASRKTVHAFIPGYIELYPEGAALAKMGDHSPIHRLTLFFKHVPFRKITSQERKEMKDFLLEAIKPYISNIDAIITSKLLTPYDLKQIFFFPGGNIDHTEIAEGQTYLTRTYSSNHEEDFYQFGNHSGIFYAGSGAYPCGSVAGTAGYMCVQSWLRRHS